MTDTQIGKVAELLESTWSKTYYMKNHQSLVSSIFTLMADCELHEVAAIIKDYANNYDNVPTIATISRLAHKPKETQTAHTRQRYFEDSDGCGYLWNAEAKDYDCIWKFWWPRTRGLTKMEVLKTYGLINY